MSASPNPLSSLIMSALMSRTAAGGGAPGQTMPGQGGGLPGGGDTSGGAAGGSPDAGDQYAQQVASLKGADPSLLLRQVNQLKKVCAVLGIQNLERLPNVAGQLLKLAPQFDRVIKEIQQAANVNSAVRPPLALGAAQPPQDSSGGM